MTDKKISELPSITGANLAGTDLIPIVDISSTTTSKVTRDEFFKNISGNVGIGTSSPASLLHLQDDVAMQIRLDRTGASPSLGYVGNEGNLLVLSHNVSGVAINTGGTPTEKMRITSAGNVGIGTSSPTYPLQVASTLPQLFLGKTGQAGQIRLARGQDGLGAGYIGYTSATESNEINFFAQGGSAVANIGGQDRVIFRTGADFVSATERMRIDSSGNVGIGTSSPGSKLDVAGTIRSNSWAGTVSSSTYGSVMERGSNANGEYVRFADGTQICWYTGPAVSCTTAQGPLYMNTTLQTWTFPAAFSVAPVLSGNGGSTARFMAGTVGSAAAASYRVLSAYSDSTTYAPYLMAIGRWF